MTETYINLHLHTDSSLLDGVGLVSEYAKKAAERKLEYLCITDHGLMGAVPQQIESCEEYGLKPVIGVEAYVNDLNHLVPRFNLLSEREQELVRSNYHILLLAMNASGYSKLIGMTSAAWLIDPKEKELEEGSPGFYYKPRLSWKQIAETCADGDVICSTACVAGAVQRALLGDLDQSADDIIERYIDVFGKDRLYVEWMMIQYKPQDENNPKLFKLAEKYGLPLVLTNDTHYLEQDDSVLQRVQLLIQSKGGTINSPRGLEIDCDQLWFASENDLMERWDWHYKDNVPEDIIRSSINNTLAICKRCGDDLELDRSLKLPEIENADEELVERAFRGLKWRGKANDKRYVDQMLAEIELIVEKDFSSCFLIEEQVIRKAREFGADVGPGRGSACGSLVCWALRITDVDPIKHKLLFWRFLSPARGGKFIKLGL